MIPRQAQALKFGDRYAAKSHAGGVAAQPFMRPAIDEGKDAIAEKVGEVIKKAVESV